MRTSPLLTISLAVLAWAGPARADLAAPGLTVASEEVPVAAPPRPAAWELSLAGSMRVTDLDLGADRFVDQARAYGWWQADPPIMVGERVDAHYLWTPIVDVGASVAWLSGEPATGVDVEADPMRVRWIEVAASARLHWAKGRPFLPEPRVELGLAQERWVVHGTASDRLRSLIRVGIDWRLGTPRVGARLSIGYALVAASRSDGPAPPVGGVELSVGPYLRF